MADTRKLPPTHELILEVLAARHRLEEHAWTFDARLSPHVERLEKEHGLVGWKQGVVAKTILVWLTDDDHGAAR